MITQAKIETAAAALERELNGRSGGDEFLYEMDEDTREEFLHTVAETILRAGEDAPHA